MGVKSQQENQDFEGTAEHAEDETVADETTAAGTKVDEADDAGGRAVPTQFKATQLVVAIAVWANAISARGAHPNLSILLLNNASEQYYITIG